MDDDYDDRWRGEPQPGASLGWWPDVFFLNGDGSATVAPCRSTMIWDRGRIGRSRDDLPATPSPTN